MQQQVQHADMRYHGLYSHMQYIHSQLMAALRAKEQLELELASHKRRFRLACTVPARPSIDILHPPVYNGTVDQTASSS